MKQLLTSFFLTGLAITAAAQAPNVTSSGPPGTAVNAAPTMYWLGHQGPLPDFVSTPLKSMHFSWGVRWDATNQTAWVTGTFNYTDDHGYVAVGTKSARGMDGLNVICYADYGRGTARCDDWWGAYYDIDRMAGSRTQVVSARIMSGGVSQIVWERVAFENGRDLGLFTWGEAARVIWAYGPMEGDEAEEHPGEGIWSNLVDFKTGRVPKRPNPGTHEVPLYVAAGFTGLLIAAIQTSVIARIRVHHHVRTACGVIATLVYLGLFVWYIVASIADYSDIAALGPEARAMGDGAALSLGLLLLSGTRRFVPQTVFTVSHERMIAYHTIAGLAFVGCVAGHAIAMVEFYFFAFALRWSNEDPFWNLPGFLAAVCAVFVFVPAVFRFHISYRWFRILHWMWVPTTVLTLLHVPRLMLWLLPGAIVIVLNFIWGRFANFGTRVEHVSFDKNTMCVIMDVSRPFRFWAASTGSAADIGIAPAQYFYLTDFSLSLAWHPFSVARCRIVQEADGTRRQHMRFVIKETHGQAGGGGIVTSGINKALSTVGLLERANAARAYGSWTSKVWAAVTTAENPTAALKNTWIEGPFGRLQMPLEAYQNLIFVSGGIGVTPNLFTLQHVASISAACAADGRPAPWRNVLWTWVSRDAGMFALFAEDLRTYVSQLREAGVTIELRNFCTAHAPDAVEATADLGFDVTAGKRPDYKSEFTAFAAVCAGETSSMYSCGPLPMIDAAASAAAEVSHLMKVHHHTEEFDV